MANGKHDLLIFQIDGAVDQNQAFYKIGSDLDINGNVNGGWALWQGAPSWFAWENQGGGITTRLKTEAGDDGDVIDNRQDRTPDTTGYCLWT